jgi:Family of unknown function (DUF5335)
MGRQKVSKQQQRVGPALEGLDHLIPKPRELYFAEEAGELTGLEIVDADGVRQIVKLKDPLMLPTPQR